MPSIRVNGTEIYYEEHGSGDEAIVFSHGLLFDHRMFDRQVAVFRDRYRCIAYDHRGQGWSETPEGPVADIETVYEDAAALLEALGAVPCHFAGVSMGGFVGMRLAARRPEMLRSLILINTAPDPEPDENVPRYRKLNLVARWLGPRLVAGRVLPVMTGESTRNDPNRASEVREWKRRIGRNRRSIYKAVNGVMQREGVEEELSRVSTPTLVLAGEEDNAVPMGRARLSADHIPTARLETIPRAGHSATMEQPEAVNDAIDRFLGELSGQKPR